MHAASLNAAEAATATSATADRAGGREATEKAGRANTDKPKAPEEGAVAAGEVAAPREKILHRETARRSLSSSELALTVEETEQIARDHQLRWVKMLVRDNLHVGALVVHCTHTYHVGFEYQQQSKMVQLLLS